MSTAQQPENITPVPPAPPAAPAKGNGLGVAALVLGILALIGAVIPFLNYGAWFLGLIGLVLGIVGLVQKNKKKGVAATGTILSGIAIILSIVLAIVYTAAFAAAVKTQIDKSEKDAATPITVVYEVTGDSTDASMTWSTFNDGQSGTEQATAQKLPWSKEITVKKGGTFDFSSYLITASNGQTGADISCKITVDGKVVANQTSTGQFASVTCNASGTNK